MAITNEEKQALLNEINAGGNGLSRDAKNTLEKIVSTLTEEINDSGGSVAISGANGVRVSESGGTFFISGNGEFFVKQGFGGSPTASELGSAAITTFRSNYPANLTVQTLTDPPAAGYAWLLKFVHTQTGDYYNWDGTAWVKIGQVIA